MFTIPRRWGRDAAGPGSGVIGFENTIDANDASDDIVTQYYNAEGRRH
jgi:hypothetical protein